MCYAHSSGKVNRSEKVLTLPLWDIRNLEPSLRKWVKNDMGRVWERRYGGLVSEDVVVDMQRKQDAFEASLCELMASSGLTFLDIQQSTNHCLSRLTVGGYVKNPATTA